MNLIQNNNNNYNTIIKQQKVVTNKKVVELLCGMEINRRKIHLKTQNIRQNIRKQKNCTIQMLVIVTKISIENKTNTQKIKEISLSNKNRPI